MKTSKFLSVASLLITFGTAPQQGFAGENVKALELPEDCQIATIDPELSQKSSSDSYLEAYIQGVLDTKYPGSEASVSVRNGDVLLFHLPNEPQKASEIVAFVRDLTKRSVYSPYPSRDEKRTEAPTQWHVVKSKNEEGFITLRFTS